MPSLASFLVRKMPVLLLLVAGAASAATRDQIEADWQRQDAARLVQIVQPGSVRFVEGVIQWSGVLRDGRLRVPAVASPKIDGRLDDPCWKQAAPVPAAAADQPSVLLARDYRHVYAAITLPTRAEAGFQGSSTALDAAGAVDGVKDGRYAFHTGLEPNPWWQVDLGRRQPIGKLVVYNRLDYEPGLHNADNLLVLTSDDEKTWTLRYDNQGRFFGGVGRGKPLEADFTPPLEARFVRLQVRSDAPIYFHLDEVEIYAPGDAAENLALRRPARQSSLSQWSRGGQASGNLLSIGRKKVRFDSGTSGLLIDGAAAPADQAAVVREGDQTTVELAVPLDPPHDPFPGEITTAQGTKVGIAEGGPWQIAWCKPAETGFGKNRLTLKLISSEPFGGPVDLAIECHVFTQQRVERKVVLQTHLSAPGEIPVEVLVEHEGAVAVSACAVHNGVDVEDHLAWFVAPVAETLDRAERLAADFKLPLPRVAELRRRAAALGEKEKAAGPDSETRAALYREARWLARQTAFQNPRLDFDELLFVKRFTQETYPDVCLNHMPWCSRPGGDLCFLKLRPHDAAGEVRTLLGGALGPGHVRGMDLWWDADRIVFGYAKAKSNDPPPGWLDRRTSFELRRSEEPIHLFEIGVDGKNLRQLTRGEWSDLDPTYLANGDIAFVSERCGYSLQCNELDKDETSCNLYVMRPDGSNIRRLSVTKDGDYLPHALDDGTIGYTRWEYLERGWAHIQSIWTVRPDGTGADSLFKQHLNDPWALEDVRSIPGSTKLVAIATGHHTLAAGPVVMIDAHQGMNRSEAIGIVTPGVVPPEGGMSGATVPQGGVRDHGGHYMTPWPLSESAFLASYTYGPQNDVTGYGLYLIDVYGTKELVYRDPTISSYMPIPLRPRPRPPIYPDSTDSKAQFATCMVADVTRGAPGIAREQVRYLRIAEGIGWPYCNTYGGQRYEPDVKSVMINWNPVRVIGTVPVERDGSAQFLVPVDTAVYFQLLDENHMELRRMRSFLSFQPGEVRGCVGCHETWEKAPTDVPAPLALLRDPSVPVPPPWGDRPISFLRDVQPVFDRHCVGCHGGLKPAAGLDFCGGLTARHNRCYDTLLAQKLIARSNVGDDAKVTPPLAFGSHKSKLVEVLRSGACGRRAKLTDDDWLRLVTWIDANGPYHDGFINKRLPPAPYDLPADRGLAEQLAAIHARRCAGCHQASDVTRLDWIDLRDPSRSLFLASPLAKESSGLGRCAAPVYKDASDPDYQAVAALVRAAVEKARTHPRRDVKAILDEPQTAAK